MSIEASIDLLTGAVLTLTATIKEAQGVAVIDDRDNEKTPAKSTKELVQEMQKGKKILETPKVEVTVTEEETPVDIIGRSNVREALTKLGRQKAKTIFAQFGAKKLSEVADEDLVKLYNACRFDTDEEMIG